MVPFPKDTCLAWHPKHCMAKTAVLGHRAQAEPLPCKKGGDGLTDQEEVWDAKLFRTPTKEGFIRPLAGPSGTPCWITQQLPIKT